MGIKGTQIHPLKPNQKTQPNCQPAKPEKTGYPY